jgi:hypothetical protein
MAEKIVISKKFNGSPITVSVVSDGISMSMSISDFLLAVSKEAAVALAEDAGRNAGSPALLLTNAQLCAKLVISVVDTEVLSTLLKAAGVVIEEIKRSSVVAE